MTRQIFKILTLGLFILTSFNSKALDSLNNRKPTEFSINEAIDKGMLELKISGAYDPRIFYEVVDKDGVHYGKIDSSKVNFPNDNLFLLTVLFRQ